MDIRGEVVGLKIWTLAVKGVRQGVKMGKNSAVDQNFDLDLRRILWHFKVFILHSYKPQLILVNFGDVHVMYTVYC